MIADFNKKQKDASFRRNRAFKTAGIIILLAVLCFLFIDYKIYQKKQELLTQINDYQQQIKNIEESSQTLKKEIANADDPAYIEKIAREQANMQKPGEKVVSFINAENQQAPEQKAESFWSTDFWFGWLTSGLQWIKGKF